MPETPDRASLFRVLRTLEMDGWLRTETFGRGRNPTIYRRLTLRHRVVAMRRRGFLQRRCNASASRGDELQRKRVSVQRGPAFRNARGDYICVARAGGCVA